MCLSSVYQKTDGEAVFLCKNIARVIPGQGEVVCYDLMGARTVIPGEIMDIDLMENVILIKEKTA
ncbi:MAG: CooT family nickel-binding protein [Clostridia bacterium]|nr:CooT family nickel-binding protein [Clostridia bacterium]